MDGPEERIGAPGGLRVNQTLTIPWDELTLRATRSGGPGGQNVNKVATRVEVAWSVSESRALDPDARALLIAVLGSRLDTAGRLRVVSRRHRTQGGNRRAALERLAEIVADALVPRRARRKTRRPYGAIQARLSDKRRSAERKKRRASPAED